MELSSDTTVLESRTPVQDASTFVTLAPQEQSISSLKPSKIRQDRRYEKEGKRWVRRRDNCKSIGDI